MISNKLIWSPYINTSQALFVGVLFGYIHPEMDNGDIRVKISCSTVVNSNDILQPISVYRPWAGGWSRSDRCALAQSWNRCHTGRTCSSDIPVSVSCLSHFALTSVNVTVSIQSMPSAIGAWTCVRGSNEYPRRQQNISLTLTGKGLYEMFKRTHLVLKCLV